MNERPRDRLGRPLPPGSADRLGAGEPAEVTGSVDEAVERAIELFDAQRYFEAHEFFEHAWKSSEGAQEAAYWKAAAQVAVGCCHLQRGNAAGAVALLERGAAGAERHGAATRRGEAGGLAGAARQLAAQVRAGSCANPTFFRWPERRP